METLPEEMMLIIMQHLDAKAVHQFRQTSRAHNKLFVNNRRIMNKPQVVADLYFKEKEVFIKIRFGTVIHDIVHIKTKETPQTPVNNEFDFIEHVNQRNADFARLCVESHLAEMKLILGDMCVFVQIKDIELKGNIFADALHALPDVDGWGIKKVSFLNGIMRNDLASWTNFLETMRPKTLAINLMSFGYGPLFSPTMSAEFLNNLECVEIDALQFSFAVRNIGIDFLLQNKGTKTFISQEGMFPYADIERLIESWRIGERPLKSIKFQLQKTEVQNLMCYLQLNGRANSIFSWVLNGTDDLIRKVSLSVNPELEKYHLLLEEL